MSKNNKQSIIDKINKIKQKKMENEADMHMKKLKDIIERSNDKSKLKIKWSNKDFSVNKVIWIMSSKCYSIFNLYDSNENQILTDTYFKEVVEKIDEIFVHFWDNNNIELEDIHITIEIYEDNGNEEVDIFKKKVFCENHKLIEFCMLTGIMDLESEEEETEDETEEEIEEELKLLGNYKDILIKQYIKSLVSLEKLKLRNSELEQGLCDSCMENIKTITINYTGYEKRDLFMETSNDVGLNVEKQLK